MCVGLSAKVVRVSDGCAIVDASGARRQVSAQLLTDLVPMVHAGAAIAKITEDEEDEANDLMEGLLV